jgi:trk system potassium uptake protein TrkH
MIGRTMPSSGASPALRAHAAARVAGACAVGVVAQMAVDMPEGYFGGADLMTRFGAGYAASLVAVAALVGLALWRASRVAGWLVPMILAVNVGLFLPALASDPLIAGLVILWHLVLLAQHFFPPPLEGSRIRRRARSEAEEALARYGPALRHVALVSLALSVGVVGYRLTGRGLAEGVGLLLGYGTMAAAVPLLYLLRRAGSRSVLVPLVPAAASLLALGAPQVMLALLAVAQATLVLVLLGQHETTFEVVRDFFDHPSRLITVSFGTLIAVGTVLLTFPAAAGRSAVSALDALFTATSAACVTGLIVLDTPHDFSLFGQVVILILIQVGGLGIMTLSTFGALMLGGTLGLRGERALAEMLDLQTAVTAYRLTRFIVLSTLAIEAAGAALLTVSYSGAGLPLGQALWRGVFHAVSAFCNAGFALQSDSIVMLQRAPMALAVHAVLITLGGLGFVVLATVGSRLVRRRRQPVPVQVRTVLVASAVLVVSGAVIFGACEWNRTLEGLPGLDKAVNALFQSVTLRTAGFNSVDFTDLRSATALLMIAFMFIGASPGSTGGGVKTTTVMVLLAAIRTAITGRGEITLYEREVPREIVLRSLAIVVTSFAIVLGGLFLLLLFEPQPFLTLVFETVSAFGTVGLSLGATATLGPAGKLTIIAVMFIGRIGPLTLALLLGTSTPRRVAVRYPETRLMVG